MSNRIDRFIFHIFLCECGKFVKNFQSTYKLTQQVKMSKKCFWLAQELSFTVMIEVVNKQFNHIDFQAVFVRMT
jgi:hypothetical protein